MVRWFLIFAFCLGLVIIVDAQTINPKAKPFKISGSLGGSFNTYNVTGITGRRQPFGYSLFGNVNVKLYGWSFPFSVAISQQGSSFTQPFVRYGVSPEYKWIKLHLGYRNMKFSEFTLNKVTFLGAGIELKPKKLRFSAMYGQLRKAIEVPKNQYEIQQYARKGYGFKIGVGDKSFFDLSLFKALDDKNSLQNPDSTQLRNVPEASTTLGLTGRVSMIKNQLNFDYDGSISSFTSNLLSDPISGAGGTNDELLRKLDVNTSSNVAVAGSTGLQFQKKAYSLGVKYRYVQSGYRSLGVNYLLSDVEMITANAGTSILKNRLNFRITYGIQNNNLSNNRFAKTSRNIGSANINFRATKRLSFNINYSNFSIYQTIIKDDLFADSVLVDQTNHLANLGVTYVVSSKAHTHSYTFNGSFQDLSDQRESVAIDASNQLFNAILTYGLQFKKSRFGFSFGANYQDFSSFLATQQRYGANISLNKTLANKKLRLRFKQVWNRSILLNGFDDIFNTQFNINYAFTKKLNFTGATGLISRTGDYSFTEWTFSLGIRTRF